MSKLSGSLEQNPMLRAIVLGGLGVLLVLLLYVRVLSGSSTPTEPTATTPAPTSSGAPPAAGSAATPATDSPAAGSQAPSADAPQAPTAPATPSDPAPAPPVATDTMTPGPGLPREISRAYRQNKVVVLSIHQLRGVPERVNLHMLRSLQRAQGVRNDIAIFTFDVRRISRYARITQGVNVNRAPALVVLRPRSLSPGGVPQAAVHYGYMGARSAAQAVFDAAYSGPKLPYYAE